MLFCFILFMSKKISHAHYGQFSKSTDEDNPNKPTAEKAITNLVGCFHLVSSARCWLVEESVLYLHSWSSSDQAISPGSGNRFFSLPHSCGWLELMSHSDFLRFFFFWCGLFCKCLLNLLQYCFHIFCFGLLAQGTWNLSSPTRDLTRTPSLKGDIVTTASAGKPLQPFLGCYSLASALLSLCVTPGPRPRSQSVTLRTRILPSSVNLSTIVDCTSLFSKD